MTQYIKRLIAIIISLAGCVILAPVLLLLALLIKLDSPGPVLYLSRRMGRDGTPFTLLKFRSMYVNSPVRRNADVSYRVDEHDSRVTRMGRFLRTGFDELPQLLNVLKGDMSLIGPRPDPLDALPFYHPGDAARLRVRPGITGLAQISGRTHIPWRERVAYDLAYVEHWSLWLDAQIAFFTIFEFIPPLRQRLVKTDHVQLARPRGTL